MSPEGTALLQLAKQGTVAQESFSSEDAPALVRDGPQLDFKCSTELAISSDRHISLNISYAYIKHFCIAKIKPGCVSNFLPEL